MEKFQAVGGNFCFRQPAVLQVTAAATLIGHKTHAHTLQIVLAQFGASFFPLTTPFLATHSIKTQDPS